MDERTDLEKFLLTVDSSVFPHSPLQIQPCQTATYSSIPLPRHLSLISQEHLESAESLVQLAWAIVLGKYLSTSAICYGYLQHVQEFDSTDHITTVPVALQHLQVICAVLNLNSTLSTTLSSWSRLDVCRKVSAHKWADIGEGLAFNTALITGDYLSAGGRPQLSTTPQV
jgi:hypothetical protein